MGVIEECGMLVDELRADPAFTQSLTQLRDAITEAITGTHTRGCRERYEAVADRLAEIMTRLDDQR